MATPPSPIATPKVVTIHGVSPGPWQTMVRRVLAPHFACVTITYPDYNWSRGGPIKAIVHPLFVVAAIALAAWTIYADVPPYWYTAVPVLIATGVWIAAVQRNCFAKRTKARISNQCADACATHVVAHSFGTYLAARALESYDILFERVVFVGCVLPRRFDWQSLFVRHPAADTLGPLSSSVDIRNEIGSSDSVARLAGLTTWLTRELGSAGRKGFLPGRHDVHSVPGPWCACKECQTSTAPVHNVMLQDYGHSGCTLGIGHALLIWLPYLWGYPPVEFRDWLTVCSRAASGLHTGVREDYVDAIGLLLTREWPWIRNPDGTGRTLEAYLANQTAGDPNARSIRDEVMHRLVHAVHDARVATVNHIANEKRRWRLNPRLAIDYTLADVQTSRS